MVDREEQGPDFHYVWQRLIIINLLMIGGYLVFKLVHDNLSDLAYLHLLVNYHFGFIKRGLVGEILSLVIDEVPQWAGKALGAATILATFGLYLRLFQKSFGFTRAHAPTFVFIVGSPFFFKNFVHTLGYFDIFGCAFAIALLLASARSFSFVVLAAAGSIVLILVHQVHALLYVPTIVGIVMIRYYAARNAGTAQICGGLALMAAVAAACVYMQFYGAVPVTPEEFGAYLSSRVGPGGQPSALAFVYVWFRTITDEIHDVWTDMGDHLKHWYLAYPILFVVHWPLASYVARSIGSILSAHHRRIVLAAMGLVVLGYLLLFAIAFDYARFVSNAFVCLVLVFHAARQLPSSDCAPISLADRRPLWFAIPLTIIPRVGGIRPFNL